MISAGWFPVDKQLLHSIGSERIEMRMHYSDLYHSLNRREILKRSALGLGSLGLLSVLNADGRLSQAEAGPLDNRPPHFRGRAKRVVHFFLYGGP